MLERINGNFLLLSNLSPCEQRLPDTQYLGSIPLDTATCLSSDWDTPCSLCGQTGWEAAGCGRLTAPSLGMCMRQQKVASSTCGVLVGSIRQLACCGGSGRLRGQLSQWGSHTSGFRRRAAYQGPCEDLRLSDLGRCRGSTKMASAFPVRALYTS